MIILVLLLTYLTSAKTCSNRKPIVLVNGIISSILEAELNVPDSIKLSDGCPHQREKFTAWESFKEALNHNGLCLKDALSLVYNKEKHQLEDLEGANITVPKFGSTYAVSCLDPDRCQLTKYFYQLIHKLEGIGYEDGVDLFAAAYDFRYGFKEEYAKKLENLLKHIKETTGKKAIIVSHSMGCPIVYDALQKFKAEDYVERWVTSGGAWLGSMSILDDVLNGIKIPNVDLETSTYLIRHMESIFYVLPRGEEFDGTLVTIGDKNYTVNNIKELMGIIPTIEEFGEEMYDKIVPTVRQLIKPPVPLNCVYSNGLETVRYMKGDSITSKFEDQYSDGDGVVNIESLTYCKHFATEVKNMGKYEHKDLIQHKVFFEYLEPLVCQE